MKTVVIYTYLEPLAQLCQNQGIHTFLTFQQLLVQKWCRTCQTIICNIHTLGILSADLLSSSTADKYYFQLYLQLEHCVLHSFTIMCICCKAQGKGPHGGNIESSLNFTGFLFLYFNSYRMIIIYIIKIVVPSYDFVPQQGVKRDRQQCEHILHVCSHR